MADEIATGTGTRQPLRNGVKPASLSAIRELNLLAGQRQAEGLPTFNLTIGAPSVPPSRELLTTYHTKQLEALTEASDAELVANYAYPPAKGKKECREALASWWHAHCPELKKAGTPVTEDEVMPVNGGTGGLFEILFSLNPKKTDGTAVKVALFSPIYGKHKSILEQLGYEVVLMVPRPEEDRGDTLARSLAEQEIDGLLLVDPSNPDGVKLNETEMQKIAATLLSHEHRDMFIIEEQIYSDILMENAETRYLWNIEPRLKSNLNYMVLHSFAKNWSLPGLHSGFICAPPNILQACAVSTQMTTGVSVESQKLMAFLLEVELGMHGTDLQESLMEWRTNMQQTYRKNIEMVCEGLVKKGFQLFNNRKPEGAYYIVGQAQDWIGQKIPPCDAMAEKTHFESDRDICDFLMHSVGVVVVPLSTGFGGNPGDGAFRISAANTLENLASALEAMGEAHRLVEKHNLDVAQPAGTRGAVLTELSRRFRDTEITSLSRAGTP